jgi:hypothetical protein
MVEVASHLAAEGTLGEWVIAVTPQGNGNPVLNLDVHRACVRAVERADALDHTISLGCHYRRPPEYLELSKGL